MDPITFMQLTCLYLQNVELSEKYAKMLSERFSEESEPSDETVELSRKLDEASVHVMKLREILFPSDCVFACY